ncbi:ankyrin repeat-containing domain protein [Podospora australis]|uniref:Ankyrin repeat-containing domain protein n=1 Tax=Podospora australis TaxID=1536484 RepID=A0AAN6WHJ6_9PEZI|nr:ankyrin repeat-containing domain protein [Podospora australis]
MLLIERGSPLRLTPHEPGQFHVTALEAAIAHGKVDLVAYLLARYRQNPADEDNSPGPVQADTYAPVHYLALCFNFDAVSSIVKQLQEVGVELDVRSRTSDPSERATPLLLACKMGNFTAARALLEAGANTALKLGTRNCLELALAARRTGWTYWRQTEHQWAQERLTLVDTLAKMGVPGSEAAVSLAAANGLAAESKVLLDYQSFDFDVNKSPAEGALPALPQAARKGVAPEILTMLLDAGANVNATGPDGKTALIHAVQNHPDLATITTLVAAGADLNVADFEDQTALHYTLFRPDPCGCVQEYVHTEPQTQMIRSERFSSGLVVTRAYDPVPRDKYTPQPTLA